MANVLSFQRRIRRITVNHAALSRGYVLKLEQNGLITRQPRRSVRRGMPMLVQTMLILVFGFFAFKGLVIAQLGAAEYEARIAELSGGTAVEAAGAKLMAIDPLSNWVATQAAQLVP